MSKGWGDVMTSKRWSYAGLVFLVVLNVVLITAYVIRDRAREADARAHQSMTAEAAPAVPRAALFFGDSYFNGSAGVSADDTQAHVAATKLDYVPVIAGHGGTGFVGAERAAPFTPPYIAQLDAGALDKVNPAAIQLVVVEGGLNDLTQPDDQITRNAGTVLARMVQTFPGAKVVLLGPVATTGTATTPQKDVVAALIAAASAANVPFIDATGWITRENVGAIIGPDKVHPTVDGHKALGDQLANAVRDLGLAAR